MGEPLVSENPDALKAALLDFQAAPGSFAISLNEPRMLFEHMHAVLSLATGRRASRGGTHAADTAIVQQAARFFVSNVLLRPGADHYALLGLYKDADPRNVREHYRLLIRLTHPDFASSTGAWPSNAASRVNLAYDVLSVPEKRSDYDELLKKPPLKIAAQTTAAVHPMRARASSPREVAGRRNRKPYIFSGLAVFSAVAMLGLFLVSTPPKDESLRVSLAPVAPHAPYAPPVTLNPTRQGAAAFEQNPTALSQMKSTAVAQSVAIVVPGAVAPASDPNMLPPAVPGRRKYREVRNEAAEQPPQMATANLVTSPLRLSLSEAMTAPSGLVAPAQKMATPPPPMAATPTSNVSAPREAEQAAQNPAPTAPPLDMRNLHPLLAGLVETLQTGNGKQVQQWIENAGGQRGSAANFAEAYKRAVADARVTGLGRVNFSPRAKSAPQQVDGTVQLNLQSADQQTSVKTFKLHAYFEDHPSGPRLIKLDAE